MWESRLIIVDVYMAVMCWHHQTMPSRTPIFRLRRNLCRNIEKARSSLCLEPHSSDGLMHPRIRGRDRFARGFLSASPCMGHEASWRPHVVVETHSIRKVYSSQFLDR